MLSARHRGADRALAQNDQSALARTVDELPFLSGQRLGEIIDPSVRLNGKSFSVRTCIQQYSIAVAERDLYWSFFAGDRTSVHVQDPLHFLYHSTWELAKYRGDILILRPTGAGEQATLTQGTGGWPRHGR